MKRRLDAQTSQEIGYTQRGQKGIQKEKDLSVLFR
jgi:hypothetical protein